MEKYIETTEFKTDIKKILSLLEDLRMSLQNLSDKSTFKDLTGNRPQSSFGGNQSQSPFGRNPVF